MAAEEQADAIYLAYTVGPIAAVISPFFLGMIADRYFEAQKLQGVLGIIGGLAMYQAACVGPQNLNLFIWLLLIHMLCYMPTVGLSSVIAFNHLKDSKKSFPIVRAFGSFGWIVASVIVSLILHADETATPLFWAAGASVVFGLYSFTLPSTPPQAKGQAVSIRSILGLNALRTLHSRRFTTFLVTIFLVAIPLTAYNVYMPIFVNAAEIADPAFKLSLGTLSELVVMLAIPIVFAKLGFKWMYVIGLSAWILRFLFVFGASTGSTFVLVMAAILIHGLCFDFTLIAGQMFVDQESPDELKGQAQGLMIMASMGLGALVGAPLSNQLFGGTLKGELTPLSGWTDFWLIPIIYCFVMVIVFLVSFGPGKRGAKGLGS